MRIAVFGSTGGNGRLILTEAIRRGHVVTALARRAHALDDVAGLTAVVEGDAADPAAVGKAIAGFATSLPSGSAARGGRQAWFNFFIKPFGARSFGEFWRLWNPVYSYFLLYFVYRPLARVLPRQVATVLTFVSCGLFLHDVPAWLFARRILPPARQSPFSSSR